MSNDLIKRAYAESEYADSLYSENFLAKLNSSKYVKIYFSLIERGMSRSLMEGIEKHHFIPKSMGGSLTVNLTFREHFIAHLLLTKIFTSHDDSKKMYFALNMMLKDKYGNRHKPNSRWYEYNRKKLIKALTGRIVSEETRQKISKNHKGKKVSDESKKKMSQAKTGKTVFISKDHAEKISAALKNVPKSAEHKKQLSIAKLGKPGVPRSEQWKKKISEANKARWEARRNQNAI